MKRLLLALAMLPWVACREPELQAPAPEAAASPAPRAAVAIEPPRLRIGEVAVVEVVVVTPPDHRVHPVTPPESVAGLWLLDAEALPVERSASRWTQRTRIRVRAREVGKTEWPRLHIDVEGPEGERSALETEPRPLEVVSVLSEFPDQAATFPYRLAEAPPPRAPALAAAAAGALAALGAVALARVVRRRRRAGAAPAPPSEAAWQAALAGLDAAAAEIDTDWRRCADRAGCALRRYVTLRFGQPLAFRTTEEALALAPPFAMATRWAALLDVLRALDAVRFRPGDAPETGARVRESIAAARRWVETTIPPGSAR